MAGVHVEAVPDGPVLVGGAPVRHRVVNDIRVPHTYLQRALVCAARGAILAGRLLGDLTRAQGAPESQNVEKRIRYGR